MLTRHQSVEDELRGAILTGAIPPGARLLQVDLADRFGVSRIPLREALRTLQAEGLVVIEPNRGAVCRPLEADDLSGLYALRQALEDLAVRSAALRAVDMRVETADWRERALDATARRDLAALIGLDRDFHALLAGQSGNAHLAHALGRCWSQIMRGMHYYFRLDVYPKDVWDEHTAIARAIAAGDGASASAILGKHISHSRQAILDGLRGASV